MQVNNLKAGFESTEVLNDINFCLSQGDKVGLVGANGSGKSTLLKVLAKELSLTSGKINLENENISYLKQEISHEFDDYSIIDYIKDQTGIGRLETRISELEKKLTSDNMNEYGDVLDKFMFLDGYSFESNLQNIMKGLKLNKNLDNKISNLSGGEKIKVLLCAMILNNGDILLLDEPTNNLDIEAINWLENYLKNSQKSIIMVSHDEVFLNNIVSKIFEMSDGKIKEYNLGYNDYLKQKDIEYEQNKSSYINRLEERKKIKDRLHGT